MPDRSAPVTFASAMPSPSTLTVKVVHGRECPHRNKPDYHKCVCRKQLYVYENGKDRTESAKTRSWEQAEREATRRKGELDPLTRAARKLDEERARLMAQEEQKRLEAEARRITIDAAFAEWRDGCKKKSDSLETQRNTVTAKFKDWAQEKKLTYLDEVTLPLFRGWISKWSPNADNPRDRLKPHSQIAYLARLKNFFAWAVEAQRLDTNPTTRVRCEQVDEEESQTQPLSSEEQFQAILAATYRYDADYHSGTPSIGRDMRAIFLLQRWTGIRISDATALRRNAIKRGPDGIYRMTLKTRKTGAWIRDRPLPTVVVEALLAVPENHPGVRDGYYFWSTRCEFKHLTRTWTTRIKALNEYLSLFDEDDEAMNFTSHMLRDTFAVELLMAEVPIEEVSKLLTHKTIAMTQRYYAPWIAKRREKMHANMMRAMESMGASFMPTAAPPADQATKPQRIM